MPKYPELTEIQNDVLDYIKTYVDAEDSAPTRTEISSAFGWKSPNAAECHLRAIAKKGYIRLVPGISRGIRIVR